MGWWGHDIMGGDSPLDVKDAFEDEMFNKYTPEAAVSFVESLQQRWKCDEEIIAQSVGWLVMHHGLPINEELRSLIIEGCDDDQSSNWIETDQRIQAVAELKSLIQSYPLQGQRIALERSTLFGQMADKLSKLDIG